VLPSLVLFFFVKSILSFYKWLISLIHCPNIYFIEFCHVVCYVVSCKERAFIKLEMISEQGNNAQSDLNQFVEKINKIFIDTSQETFGNKLFYKEKSSKVNRPWFNNS